MSPRLYSVVIDAHDPLAQARFWAEALRFRIVYQAEDEVVVARDETTYPTLTFVPVPERKSIKNRLHLDLAPDDRDAEVDRLIGLGASRADVGQGPDVSWVVLADPEGNEFCVLSARPEGI
ncbi:MAG TPA: VOC family protein, partial [Candidatus Dormibacteraeota bacterium]